MKLKLDMTLEEQRTRPKKYPTAGKPKKANKKERLTVRLSPALLEKLRIMRINRSQFIEQAIKEKLEGAQ